MTSNENRTIGELSKWHDDTQCGFISWGSDLPRRDRARFLVHKCDFVDCEPEVGALYDFEIYVRPLAQCLLAVDVRLARPKNERPKWATKWATK